MWAFLLVSLVAVNVTACGESREQGTVKSSAPSGDRPNIIFLLADDQRTDTLSVSGHPFSQTPNIDELARQGIRYTNAFTVEPICAPSRFAFLSGQYERSSGLGFNSPYEVVESQWQKTYPALLNDAGYHTGFIGKFGVQFYSFAGDAASKFDYWRAHDGWLPFFPKDLPENPATAIYSDAEHNITTEIMGEYIEDFLSSRPVDVPFNLSVSFSAPHNSVVSTMYPEGADPDCETYACKVMGYAANENPKLKGHPVYDTLYRDESIEIAEDTGRDPYGYIPEGVIDHAARRQWYDYNYYPELQPEHLVRYQQNVTGIDRVVGQMVAQLERLGLADNTIIIYSSDHGLLNGEYGTGGKGLLYDLVAKIPLIIFDPRDAETAAERSELVLSIDVPSTILSYAGVAVPETMQGRALGSGEAPRDAVFLESLTVAEGNPFIEALRTQEWKYVRYLQAEGCPYTEAHLDFSAKRPVFEQLFHLPSDPEEKENLADLAEHAAVLEDFRARTQRRSTELTAFGRDNKQAMSVGFRPVDGVYCW